ncbi:hypothetical protein ABE137_12650 [Brevibacillus laterosporus]|uniref:hypothetical protein n=1 Tax=Brevibacillus laterosporus TaxID=1465 RepID=UPI0006BDD2A7|nr:putative structural protein [Brevibacillus phage Sundance]ALA47838.1 putative structural protein [Brevibacillus phage Sundance]
MAVIRLDKIAGVHLESVVHTAEMKNGYFVQLGALVAGETELYEVKVPAVDADLKKEFVLVSAPEVMVDPRKAGLKHFVIEAGTTARAYHLVKGDVITLTEDLIDGTPVKNQFVVPQAGSMKLEASADGGSVEVSLVLEVVRETTLGYDNTKAFQLRVIKA